MAAWWPTRPGNTPGDTHATDESVTVADEFSSADALDNDLPAKERASAAMGVALERLRGRHLPFRRPEKADEVRLEELRLQILRAVTAAPELDEYYREAWSIPAGEASASVRETAAPYAHRPLAVMQIELMLRAFYVLQLQLYANAPENHGWMTLFRSWGRSARFNSIFDELESTLPPEFRKFYRLYLHQLPDRTSTSGHLPVHHPWLDHDAAQRGLKGRGIFMDSGRLEAEVEIDVRPGAGGVVDSRGRDGADQSYETPSDSDPSAPDGGSAPNR